MTALSLKVGETYTTRDGNRVRITSETQPVWWNLNPFHKLNGSNGEIYRIDGRCGWFGQSRLDIVAESKDKLYGDLGDALNAKMGLG